MPLWDVFQAHGENTNAFIGRAISETIERDSGAAPETAGKPAGTEMQPSPVDRAKAAEKLFGILGDLGIGAV